MAQLASIRQMSGQVSRGSAGDYQAYEREGGIFKLFRIMAANWTTSNLIYESKGEPLTIFELENDIIRTVL